jgi:hypothetical protein
MDMREKVLREQIGNVTGPREGEFVDSMGRGHTTAMDLMRAEVRYMLHRKF